MYVKDCRDGPFIRTCLCSSADCYSISSSLVSPSWPLDLHLQELQSLCSHMRAHTVTHTEYMLNFAVCLFSVYRATDDNSSFFTNIKTFLASFTVTRLFTNALLFKLKCLSKIHMASFYKSLFQFLILTLYFL